MSNAKLARVIEIIRELEVRKALYDELDRLVLELQSGGFVSEEVNGLRAELVDNFAEGKNTVFRPAGVKRYEMTVEPVEDYLRKKAKREKKAGAV